MSASIAGLEAEPIYHRAGFIEKCGWAVPPRGDMPNAGIARSRVEALIGIK